MKPYSFVVPLPDVTTVVTGTLLQMEKEMAKQPSRSKLQLILIDDGSAQKLFTSLYTWITEQGLSERIHLSRATGKKCTLKVQFTEEGKPLEAGARPKTEAFHVSIPAILETFLIFLNRIQFSVLSFL